MREDDNMRNNVNYNSLCVVFGMLMIVTIVSFGFAIKLAWTELLPVTIIGYTGVVLETCIFLLDTHGGLFTDTIFIDEEKIEINKKKYNKTIYWENVKEIQEYWTRGGNLYYIVEFGATGDERNQTQFTCSNKFKKHMYKMFEQAKKRRLEEYKNRMQETEAKSEA